LTKIYRQSKQRSMNKPQITLKTSILSLTIFLISLFENAYCQEMPPILKTTEYQPGIYLNYLEFLTNAPSIKEGFVLTKRKPFPDISLVFLDIKDKSLKKQVKNFWGVSDGESIFISSPYVVKGSYNVSRYQLSLLVEVNRYCLFLVEHHHSGPYTRGIESIPFAMNINNGISFPLKKENVKNIIGDDTELLSKYQDERKKNSIWVKSEYIINYNKTHQHEINFNKATAKIVVFRRAKKDNAKEVAVKKPEGNETHCLRILSSYITAWSLR
jgi:hypothetical protein